MNAPDGEQVSFSEPVYAEGPVEYWLREVETMMMRTTRDRTLDAITAYPSLEAESPDSKHANTSSTQVVKPRGGNRLSWIFAGYPAQCVIMVDQIMWTRAVSEALSSSGKSNDSMAFVSKGTVPVSERLSDALNITVDHIQEMVAGVRGKLDRHQRRLAGALITLDVHGRDVIRSLRSKWCRDRHGF